jgi:hypothetical protein
MKILYSLVAIVKSEQIIKNINVPSCRNCVHFKPPYYGEFTSSLSKCDKFGNKDIITDKISYNDFADMSRQDGKKCGNEGKYFELEKNLQFKIFMHQIIHNLPNIIIISTLVVQLLTVLKITM